MTDRETWPKGLKCPVCGREGEARLSHLDDPSHPFGFRTLIEECPEGFVVREDEDDADIFRFYCAAHNVSADQGG